MRGEEQRTFEARASEEGDITTRQPESLELRGGQVPSWRDLVAKREAALAGAREKEKDGKGKRNRYSDSDKRRSSSDERSLRQHKKREKEKRRAR